MATTIKLKNGSGAPLAGDLVAGEPALDLTNKRLYTEDSGGTVIEIGTSPSTIDINAGTIDGTVIGGSSAAAGTFTTFTSTGIDDNATSTAITIDSSQNVSLSGDLTVDTNTLFVDASANTVSINNTNAEYPLDVFGDARVRGNGSGTARLYLEDRGTPRGNFVGMDGYDDLVLAADEDNLGADSAMKFRVDATERMRIDSSGNVGIGTISPSVLCHIAKGGGSAILEIQRTDSNTLGTVGAIQFNANDDHAVAAVVAIGDGDNEGAHLAFNTTSAASANSYYTSTTERMRIDSSGNVIIANSSKGVSDALEGVLFSGAIPGLSYFTRDGGLATSFARLNSYGGVIRIVANGNQGGQIGSGASGALSFYNGAGTTERMRLDSSGNLLVGKTTKDTYNTTAGIEAQASGLHTATRSGVAQILNRLSSDGDIAVFRKDGTTVGSIGTYSSGIYVATTDGTDSGLGFRSNQVVPCTTTGTNRDNAIDLGASGSRFDDVYATNGTIQTSDVNEKQDMEALSEAEQRVAVAAKGLLRKFRWKSAVEEKGDDARVHFGIIAQDLQAAFEAEGLDAGDYGMFIHSTWTDEETGEERSRMGVRYSELLAFIIAAI